MKIAVLTISDRAARGIYEDKSGVAIKDWLKKTISSDYEVIYKIVEDGVDVISQCLIEFCDDGVDLILTTGGTGPSPRDLTPEAMALVAEKELPGFGELMRKISLEEVPTAILSRQSAFIRKKSLIINLPGKPASIDVCLNAVFPAVPYCLDLIGAGYIETDERILKSFRPKNK